MSINIKGSYGAKFLNPYTQNIPIKCWASGNQMYPTNMVDISSSAMVVRWQSELKQSVIALDHLNILQCDMSYPPPTLPKNKNHIILHWPTRDCNPQRSWLPKFKAIVYLKLDRIYNWLTNLLTRINCSIVTNVSKITEKSDYLNKFKLVSNFNERNEETNLVTRSNHGQCKLRESIADLAGQVNSNLNPRILRKM